MEISLIRHAELKKSFFLLGALCVKFPCFVPPGSAGRLTGFNKVQQASLLALITQAGSLPAGGGTTGDQGLTYFIIPDVMKYKKPRRKIDFHEYPIYSKPQFPKSDLNSVEFYRMAVKSP